MATAIVLFGPSLRADQRSFREGDIAERQYVGAAEPNTPATEYGLGVRTTEWRSPADEQRSFHLPPGFQIELVASEPQIAKPLNMAWDAQGRLWITNTVEYPFPAPADRPPRDSIRVLEDTDGDGKLDKVTTFADGLNIPMGLLPVPGGVLCFEIPNLVLLTDTDGDGHADRKETLLGPFDTTRDTHGLVNALRRGHDGWIYACHGFNNQSHVEAADGSRVHLISGNTFCFSDTGDHVELFTRGQVNPFGMTEDQYGNWYTADCHSRPLTALIPGACYPSFGRPHDGLGFAPEMMQHLHGSTAISGLAWVDDETLPPPYRNVFYSGNVMTSRINANRLVRTGGTVTASELPDFLTSDDPWFRPVDIQLGPDGALYVADFYNRIIGHYEVPLDHPGRDRHSGRIWRIAYVGEELAEQRRQRQQLVQQFRASAPLASVAWQAGLASTNTTLRRITIERLIDQQQNDPTQLVNVVHDIHGPALVRAGALEVLMRLGMADEAAVRVALRADDQCLRSHVYRMARHGTGAVAQVVLDAARKEITSERLETTPHESIKAAVAYLMDHAGDDDVPPLWAALLRWNRVDPTLAHACRIALTRTLRRSGNIDALVAQLDRDADGQPDEVAIEELQKVLTAIDAPAADRRLWQLMVETGHVASPRIDLLLERLSPQSATPQDVAIWVSLLDQWRDHPDAYGQRFQQIWQRFADHPPIRHEIVNSLGPRIEQWLTDVEQSRRAEQSPHWLWLDVAMDNWPLQERSSQDGRVRRLLSSHPRGEVYEGVLSSEPFACPPRLEFWIAGHNGPPGEADSQQNRVRLIHMENGALIAEVMPPRSDVARLVQWELSDHEGEMVRIELVDGERRPAYAWLAAGDFSLPMLNPPAPSTFFLLNDLFGSMGAFVPQDWWARLWEVAEGRHARALVARSFFRANGDHVMAVFVESAIAEGTYQWLDRLCAHWESSLQPLSREARQTLAQEFVQLLGHQGQERLADRLVISRSGQRFLLDLIDAGTLSLTSARAALRSRLEQLDQALADRLKTAAMDEDQAEDLAEQIRRVAERIRRLPWEDADRQLGQEVFRQHCSPCHQRHGVGATIGPQLDGVVGRGYQRLGEDILLPNLNLDPAFRTEVLVLDDDRVLQGLTQPLAEARLRIVQSDGRAQVIEVDQIVARKRTDLSLMPSNFSELIGDRELASLLLFLNER